MADEDEELQVALALSLETAGAVPVPPVPATASEPSSVAHSGGDDGDVIISVLRASDAARRSAAERPRGLLVKYLTNIVASPEDAKFRSLRLANIPTALGGRPRRAQKGRSGGPFGSTSLVGAA